MRLRTTLFGLLVVISIVLAGTVYAGFALHKQDVETRERTSLETTADSIGGALSARFQEKRRAVNLTTRYPSLADHGSPGQLAVLLEAQRETEFHSMVVTDEDGILITGAAPHLTDERRAEHQGSNLSHRDYLGPVLDGEIHVSDPFVSLEGHEAIAIGAPIHEDGAVAGALVGVLYLEDAQLFSHIDRWLEDAETAHVTAQGTAIYETGESPESALVSTARVAESRWTVTVRQDRDPLAARLWLASIVQIVAVAVAVLSVAAVGVWVSRTTIVQLRTLIDGLADLERGRYDRDLDVGVTDEWARISSQFNALSNTLDGRESQLQVLNRVLRHNLRNDMSVVIAHAETMLHDGDLDADAERKTRTIRDTAQGLMETSEHARALYDELLGGFDGEHEPVDVTTVVRDTVDRLRTEFPESTVRTDLPERAVVYDGDTVPIVVAELVRNALVHNDRPVADRVVSVDVTVADPDGEVTLEISDNGPGMPALEADLLIGSREETDIDHGSGLGLWLVNWLVARLDGEIELRTLEDRGTSITVRLPGPPDGDEMPADQD